MIGRRAALRMGAVSLLSAAIALAGGTWALMERAFTVPPSPGGRPAPAADGPADPWGFEEIDWAGWARESPDMAAWVQIPAAGLSLPVMAAPADDPGRYLDRDAWGGWNFAGTPFLDAECAGDFDAGCAPVLGHHLAGGRGFSVLAVGGIPRRRAVPRAAPDAAVAPGLRRYVRLGGGRRPGRQADRVRGRR